MKRGLKKVISLILVFVMIFSLTGCDGIIEKKKDDGTVTKEEIKSGIYIIGSNGKIYVTNTKNQNFSGITNTANTSRLTWTSGDKFIPTIYGDDLLVLYSETMPKDSFSIEGFKDLGYTIGIAPVSFSTNGMITIPKNSILSGSNAYDILYANCKGDGWILAEINDNPVKLEDISNEGMLLGFKENESVKVGMFQGTRYGQTQIKANTRVFVSYMTTETVGYDLTKEGYAIIDLGELEDGYYSVNGTGLFELRRAETRK